MSTKYVQEGKVIPFAAGANLSSDAVVVIGGLVGVVLDDVTSGQTGQAQICGVFDLPKVSGAVIAAGETLTWDVSAGAFDDDQAVAAAGDITGAAAVAVEAAGNGVTTVRVLLTGVPGTVN